LHRLKDMSVLAESVAAAPATTTWETEGVGVADTWDERSDRYGGLVAPGSVAPRVTGTTVLVRPDVTSKQLQVEQDSATVRRQEIETDAGVEAAPPQARRFFGVITVDADRLPRDA